MNTKVKKKVLVIDDDQSAFGIIGDVLGPKGLEVYAVSNLENVVEETGKISPDLIFISLLLNESNGLKVSKSIRSIEGLHDVPILMIISFHGELDPKYTRTIGIVDVLVRPLSENDVLSKTLNILGGDAVTDEFETLLEVSPEEGLGETSLEKDWSDEFDLEVQQLGGSEKTSGVAFVEESPEDREEIFKIEEKEINEHLRETEGPEGNKSGNTDDYADYDLQDESMDSSHDKVKEDGQEAVPSGLSYDVADEGKEPSQETVPEKTGSNKIFLAIGILIAIAGLAAAAFFVKNTFYAEKKGPVPSVMKKAPVEKEPAKQETIKEAIPGVTKPADGAPVAGAEKAGKPAAEEQVVKSGPVPSVKPPVKGDQQSASALPPVNGGKKATEEKKEMKKAPKEGAYIYAAQAGVFENEKNADALVAKLKKMGLNAYIQKDSRVVAIKKKKDELISENIVMYRVLAGKFDNNKKALEQVRLLKEDGIEAVPYRY